MPDPALAASATNPGVGHSYIGTGVETVNPVDGTLSFELPIDTPPGRSLSLPFGFRYSSTEPFYLTNNNNGTLGTSLFYQPRPAMSWELNGWSYDLPTLAGSARIDARWQDTSAHQCDVTQNFVFRPIAGPQYTIGLGQISSDAAAPGNCSSALSQFSWSGHGTTANATTIVGNIAPPVTAVDQSGTTYSFQGGYPLASVVGQPGPIWQQLPQTITDRNGNFISLQNNVLTSAGLQQSTNGFYDTLHRLVVSWTGLGGNAGICTSNCANPTNTDTVTVSGLGQVTVQWTNKQVTFPETVTTPAGAWSAICNKGTTLQTTINVVTQISLPNQKAYTFEYDPTYGTVNKIFFPDGGYVRYQWALNTSSAAASFITQYPTSVGGAPQFCAVYYDTPAVTDRWVSYDGIHEVQHQQFTYYPITWGLNGNSVLWSSKKTQVKTTDLLTNQVTVTVYNYSPVNADQGGPYDLQLGNNIPRQAAVETAIAYQDGSNNTLRTVNSSWNNLFAERGSQTILENGQGSASLLCYDANEQVTDVYEYGFQSEGTKGADPACASSTGLTTTAIGPLKRHTVAAYHNFLGASPSAHIVNAPDSVTVYDAATNQLARTTLTYSQTVTPSGASTNLVTPSTARGNVASATSWLSSGTSPTTTYTYYDTGQLASMTDACGNTTCSDMTGSSHTITFSYSDNFAGGTGTPPGQTNAYLKQVVYPNTGVAHSQTFSWGYNDGLLRSAKDDQNGATTTYAYADSLLRLTQITNPDGGSTTTCYTDAGGTCPQSSMPPYQVISQTSVASGITISTTSVLDGMGHVTQTQLTSDPDGATYSDIAYDGFGRVSCTSNPYRSTGDSTFGITTQLYDALGRVTQLQPPDYWSATSSASPTCQTFASATPANPTNKITTAYSGNTVTVTDQAGKPRTTVTDSLGRLAQVLEDPGASPHLNYETDYSYDLLDNLTCVAQKGSNTGTFANCASTPAAWRPRSFIYDSLSRLTQAVNPESGTVNYVYDANNNVSTKTSPKPNQTGTATVITTFSYDNWNRITQKSFNDSLTPTMKYGYDGVALAGCATTPPTLTDSNPIGSRTAMCDGAGAESWSHDSMGRILFDSRTTNGLTATYPYTYNLDGSVKTVTYAVPGSTVETITYTQGGAGRPVSETSVFNGTSYPYVSAAHYAPNGALCGLSYFGNGAAQNVSFNPRFQPQHWHVTATPWGGHSAPQPCQPPSDWTAGWIDRTYNYIDASSHNSGNVAKITNNVNHYWSQNFTYDSLNRIATAQTDGTFANGGAGNCWAETYNIDAWGNLQSNAPNPTTQSAYTGCIQEAPANLTGAIQPSNRLSGMGFTTDAAGNLIADGVHTFTYDAENHLLSTAQTGQTTVTYKYDGDGKRVQKSSGTLYWYGLNNQPLMETTLTGTANFAYYYFNGRLTNRRPWSHVFNLDTYILDALGNTDLVSGLTTAGGPGWDYSDYYPYGGEWAHQVAAIGNHYKFTGKERDPESGDDNFLARQYSSNLGRFMSPDPSGIFVADASVPQSWNLYSYVLNNPLRFVDPDGLDKCVSSSGEDAFDDNGGSFSSQATCEASSDRFWIPSDYQTVTVNADPPYFATQSSPIRGTLVDPTAGGLGRNIGIGVLRELGNTLDSFMCQFNEFTCLISGPSIFRSEGTNQTQAAAMTTTSVALIFVPIGGEEKLGAAAEDKALNYLYQKLGPAGEHLKFGVTDNLAGRYTKAKLAGGYLKKLAEGSRVEMLRLERNLHENLPLGREERQWVYYLVQYLKGYRLPPY